jgi:hypothetical protein
MRGGRAVHALLYPSEGQMRFFVVYPCMPLGPHVIDTKKYTYMPLSGTQGMSIKSDGIPEIFSSSFHLQGDHFL